jgi:hypothetical protein
MMVAKNEKALDSEPTNKPMFITDDEFDVEMLDLFLVDFGYSVVTASNGLEPCSACNKPSRN